MSSGADQEKGQTCAPAQVKRVGRSDDSLGRCVCWVRRVVVFGEIGLPGGGITIPVYCQMKLLGFMGIIHLCLRTIRLHAVPYLLLVPLLISLHML